ncbi:hypothetical protein GCM10009784_08090 [Arthrobacter parietis]|uniref:Uncharacterized protein n=1 Tax=Arthrobacter parietis TaxID=271434 RepID=A0ABN3ARA5_9MICC
MPKAWLDDGDSFRFSEFGINGRTEVSDFGVRYDDAGQRVVALGIRSEGTTITKLSGSRPGRGGALPGQRAILPGMRLSRLRLARSDRWPEPRWTRFQGIRPSHRHIEPLPTGLSDLARWKTGHLYREGEELGMKKRKLDIGPPMCK